MIEFSQMESQNSRDSPDSRIFENHTCLTSITTNTKCFDPGLISTWGSAVCLTWFRGLLPKAGSHIGRTEFQAPNVSPEMQTLVT